MNVPPEEPHPDDPGDAEADSGEDGDDGDDASTMCGHRSTAAAFIAFTVALVDTPGGDRSTVMRPTHVHSLDPGTLQPEARERLHGYTRGETDFEHLPSQVVSYLTDIVEHLSRGETVNVIVQEDEVSTVEAAKLLGVSRPFLIKLLDRNRIPHRRVGSDRRILASDLTAYILEQKEARGHFAATVDQARTAANERIRAAADVDDETAKLLGL